ncbi:hypothetical protein K438DRAFT_468672 [Mycena galopus ATCC 62051]|nr:hypothetical protein K438DRAFT_468672 [Mycena galopus ATCC 62051]
MRDLDNLTQMELHMTAAQTFRMVAETRATMQDIRTFLGASRAVHLPVETATRTTYEIVRGHGRGAGREGFGSGDQMCYLITDPLHSDWVQNVVFTICGHDQGWSAHDLEHNGTTVRSRTWFEATIVRRENPPPWAKAAAHSSPLVYEFDQETEALSSFPEFHTDGWYFGNHLGSRWFVAANLRATWKKQRHKCRWSRDDWTVQLHPTGEKEVEVILGPHAEFIRALRVGDQIALIARAECDAWQNHVLSATIDVHYE